MQNVSASSAARLLVIEDDHALQNLMSAIFVRRGITIDFADDGDTALDCLRANEYDAVILDLFVPGPNGFDIIRELKRRNSALLAPTIVLTAASEVTLRQFSGRADVRRIIRKPFDIDDLVGEVLSLRGDPALLENAQTFPVEAHVQ